MSCLTARELRKNEKVWILGWHLVEKGWVNLLFAVFCSHCFFYLDLGFYFSLPDVDECANSRSCPKHSTCHNSLGSYSCVCNPGYQSRSGRKNFQGPGEICEGIIRGLLGNQVQCVWEDRCDGEKFRWISVELKALISNVEANSNWFIHAFIQQTLLERLLYDRHYSRDGGYSNNTKNISVFYWNFLSMVRESDNKQNAVMYLGYLLFGLSLLTVAWHSPML